MYELGYLQSVLENAATVPAEEEGLQSVMTFVATHLEPHVDCVLECDVDDTPPLAWWWEGETLQASAWFDDVPEGHTVYGSYLDAFNARPVAGGA